MSVLRMRPSTMPILQSGILIPLMESEGCSIIDHDGNILNKLEFGKKSSLPAQVKQLKLSLHVEKGAFLCFLWILRTKADGGSEQSVEEKEV